MEQDEKESTKKMIASEYILLASDEGGFLTWPASEQERASRALKTFFEQAAAVVNRKPMKFFGSTFLAEVIFHTNDSSVCIALALVYPSDTDSELVLQTSDWVKKTIQEALAAVKAVSVVGGLDSAKVSVIEGDPGKIINGLSVCAYKHAADLANKMRSHALVHGVFEGAFTMGGETQNWRCKEVASPNVTDVTLKTEMFKVRNVSDETRTCVFRTGDGKARVELSFSEEKRNALLYAQAKKILIEVTYSENIHYKIGRKCKSGGLIQSIQSDPQGALDFDAVVSQESEGWLSEMKVG